MQVQEIASSIAYHAPSLVCGGFETPENLVSSAPPFADSCAPEGVRIESGGVSRGSVNPPNDAPFLGLSTASNVMHCVICRVKKGTVGCR